MAMKPNRKARRSDKARRGRPQAPARQDPRAPAQLQVRRDVQGRVIQTRRVQLQYRAQTAIPDVPADGAPLIIPAVICTDNDVYRAEYDWDTGWIEFQEVLDIPSIDLQASNWPIQIGLDHDNWDISNSPGIARDPQVVALPDDISGIRCQLEIAQDHPLFDRIRRRLIQKLSIDYVVPAYRDVTGQDGYPEDMTTLLALRTEILAVSFVMVPADAYSTTIRAAFDPRLVEGGFEMPGSTAPNGTRARRGQGGTGNRAPNGTRAERGQAAPQRRGGLADGGDDDDEGDDGDDGDGDGSDDVDGDEDGGEGEDDLDDAGEEIEVDAEQEARDNALLRRARSAGMPSAFFRNYLGTSTTPSQLTARYQEHLVRTARSQRGGRRTVTQEVDASAFGISSSRNKANGRARSLIRAAAHSASPDIVKIGDTDAEAREMGYVGPVDLYRYACQINGIRADQALQDPRDIWDHMRSLRTIAGRSVAPNVMADYTYLVEQTAGVVMVSANAARPFTLARIMRRVGMSSWLAAASLIATSADPLEELIEGEEIPAGGFRVFDDKMVLAKLGKRYPMSRELIENNSAELFTNLANLILTAANIARSRLVLDGIKGNKVMSKDGVRFFAEARGNVGENMPVNEASITTMITFISGDDDALLNEGKLLLVVDPRDLPAANKLNAQNVFADSADNVSAYAGRFTVVAINGLPQNADGTSRGWMILPNPDVWGVLLNLEKEGQAAPIIRMLESEQYDAMVAKVLYDRGFAFGDPYKGYLAFTGAAPEELTLSDGTVIDPEYGL